MKTVLLSITMGLVGSGFLAAQDVAPPPRPADAGPTLAATMQFIQEKLGAIGPVNYISYLHDNVVGNDWTNTRLDEVTNLQINVAGCLLTYHRKSTSDGKVVVEADEGVPLKEVTEVVIETREQTFKRIDTNAGHPQYAARVDPPVFSLVAKRKVGENRFFLFNEALANRLAKAFVHAVEVCGGGNNDPF